MAFNLFTWWQGLTFGTWLDRLGARAVGEDAEGNRYFVRGTTREGRERRFVSYAIDNDASRVPPEWHLWLHHGRAEPPSAAPLPTRGWERPWRPNPTGTALSERPAGALAAGGRRAAAAADYRAWTPDAAAPRLPGS